MFQRTVQSPVALESQEFMSVSGFGTSLLEIMYAFGFGAPPASPHGYGGNEVTRDLGVIQYLSDTLSDSYSKHV